jgi:hypothetical protein
MVDVIVRDKIEPIDSMYLSPGEQIVEVSPAVLPTAFAQELRQATHYGGTEFLNLLIESVESLTARRDPASLPAPIDPSEV